VVRAIRIWLDKDGIYRDFEAHMHIMKTNPINGDLMIFDTEDKMVASYRKYERVEMVNDYRGSGVRYILWDMIDEQEKSELGENSE